MIYFLFSRLTAVLKAGAMLLIASLFTAFPALNITPAAHAQERANCDDHAACRASERSGFTCRVYVDSRNGSRRLHELLLERYAGDRPRTTPFGCYRGARTYGLKGFRFNMRGGHKMQNFGMMQEANSIDFWLTDKESEDEKSDGFVWLSGMPEGSEEFTVVEQNCRGECILRLEREDTTRAIVLSGFRFIRKDGDGHVRRIAILPQRDEASVNPTYRVAFQDDDFEYEVRVQYVLAPRGKIGPVLEISKSYDGNDDGRMTIGEREPVHSDLISARQQGNVVLRGFDLRFTNGGHFIEDIGIEPDRTAYQVWFQDHQGDDSRRRIPDDPIEWRILYSQISF